MQKDKQTGFNSFIAFGFGSSDTGVSLYWSNDALKTIEKQVYKQYPDDNLNDSEPSDKKP